MIDFGYVAGWIGVALGLCVPVPQLIQIVKTRKLRDISLGTYSLLCGAIACYLIHAIYISAEVFVVAQSINLVTNTVILILLIRNKRRDKDG